MDALPVRRTDAAAETRGEPPARTGSPAARSRRSPRRPSARGCAAAASGPGSTGTSAATTISQSGSRTQSATASRIIAGAITSRRSSQITAASRARREVVAATLRSWPRSARGRGRSRGGRAASRPEPRCRARAARAPRHHRAPRPARGRTDGGGRSRTRPGPPPTAGCGGLSGRSIRPTWSTKTRSAPRAIARPRGIEFTMPPSRKCSPSDLGRRQQTGDRGAGHDRVDQGAGGEPVLGRALDAGRAHLEPHRQLLEGRRRRTPPPAASA